MVIVFTSYSGRESRGPVITEPLFNDTGIVLDSGGGACTSSEEDCNYGRDATVPDPTPTDGHAGFSFTKLAANGTELTADAISWVCVKDNVTGLVWEAKTVVEGTSDQETWANAPGAAASFSGCGAYSTCRLPTAKELLGIVAFGSSPDYIDTNFFPNNVTSAYWTGTPVANDPGVDPVNAWVLNFVIPYLDGTNTVDNTFYVRAVCE